MEYAGITLRGGDLMGLVQARKMALATICNFRQDLFFAFAHMVVGVRVAVEVLHPLTGTLLSPKIGAAAMGLSSVSVFTSTLRLRRVAF